MSMTIVINSDCDTIEVPFMFEICTNCKGHGTHLHDGMRGHAYSQEEFNETFDEDDSREYFKHGGRYDVKCNDCSGSGKVKVPDLSDLSDEEIEAYERYENEAARDDAEDRYLRRIGY